MYFGGSSVTLAGDGRGMVLEDDNSSHDGEKLSYTIDYSTNISTFERMKDKFRLSRRYSYTGDFQNNGNFSRTSSRASLFGVPTNSNNRLVTKYGNLL